MSYSVGDILLIKFPFTDLSSSKKRPVLMVKSENDYKDIVCFQITSNKNQSSLLKVEEKDLEEGMLKLQSFVKYDKCFTLSSSSVDKKLSKVNRQFLENLKNLFCSKLF